MDYKTLTTICGILVSDLLSRCLIKPRANIWQWDDSLVVNVTRYTSNKILKIRKVLKQPVILGKQRSKLS